MDSFVESRFTTLVGSPQTNAKNTQESDQRKNHEKDLPNAINSPADVHELLCHTKTGVAETKFISRPGCSTNAAESAIHQCLAATLLYGSGHGAWRPNFSSLGQSPAQVALRPHRQI